ncbi:MAG: hypothetical protein JWO38_6574 [Gemmataceae bacterium]|nr:hypothetical protein [Gemmataceae bacterium]
MSGNIAAPPATVAPSGRPRGILIIDDDEDVRRLLGASMRHHGFAVWLAADGWEAVKIYQSHRPSIDVALLDVMMPGRDGPGTMAALRELDPQVRVCFMTGYAGRYTEQDLLSLGALVQKPFRLGELAERLEGWAAPPASHEDLQESRLGDNGPGSLASRESSPAEFPSASS